MSNKPRYFIVISHCLLNPATRVHVLGKRFKMIKKILDFFLDKNISVIQLPCPEFTAMGYMRNPQGRMQYNNIFFRKHCKEELENYVDMICELKENNNTPLCYIGVQGSPTCSIYWGKHKMNRYKTESMEFDLEEKQEENKYDYGVMTKVLDEMLKSKEIYIPYLEAPIKESLDDEKTKEFFNKLYELLNIPEKYRNIEEILT